MTFRPSSVLQSLMIATALAALGACAVGPDYQTPDAALPQKWNAEEAAAVAAKAEIDQKWWSSFNDPVLDSLIDRAAAGNFDLKIAEARIAQARAGVASAEAALLPSGDVKANVSREANQMALPKNTNSELMHKPYNIYQTGFDASWELDLFGGNRRAEEEAEAQMQASEASRDDVRVSLMAEVARTYIRLRNAQAQLAIAQNTVASAKTTASIARQRADVGQAPRLDVTQAEARLEQAQAQLPALRSQIVQAEAALDVLLGEQPGAAHRLAGAAAPVPQAAAKVVLAAPASVVAQRPDIRSAERKLAAATAQQGVAVAKFFPDISLTGFFGALNTSTTKLVTGSSESWMAGGGILWPILSYNSLSANLDRADALQQEALLTYQKTVIGALSDVERSLAAYNEQQQQTQAIANEAEKSKHARATAQERFQEGLTSRLEVLEADRSLDAAQGRLVQAQADSAAALVALYKSLGGGWHAQ